MSIDAFLHDAERKLAGRSASLPDELRQALDELRPQLSEADLRSWAEEGVALAGH